MDISNYYRSVFPKLRNSFDYCNWVLGYGEELIRYGWDPNKLLVTAEPVSQLEKMTVDWNLEVYLPIFGYRGQSVLFAKDAEIFLADPYNLYFNLGSQLHYFRKHIFQVIMYETGMLQRHGLPHMIDLTPSGWHVNFKILRGTKAFKIVSDIGYLENDLIKAYLYCDPYDIKRNPPPGLDAGLVFSGVGRLKEFMALKSKMNADQHHDMPITISDSAEKCINEDITDTGDPGYMRIMRAPFGLHKKRRRFFPGSESHQDVIMRIYPGRESSAEDIFIDDLEHLLSCMWDKEKAVDHAQHFTGHIPIVDDVSMSSLVMEYRESDLYKYHREFDMEPELPRGTALYRAMNDERLSAKTRNFVEYPCPRALQPRALKKFVRNLMDKGWHPKHIGCLINDFYHQPFDWNINWYKYVSKTRGFFWARVYGAVYLLEEGSIKL